MKDKRPPLRLVLGGKLYSRSGSAEDHARSRQIEKALRKMSDYEVGTLLQEHVWADCHVSDPKAAILDEAIRRLWKEGGR